MKKYGPFDSVQVMQFLPHRYPFLFVDKITDLQAPLDGDGKLKQVGTISRGVKTATINEPYFTGHFPDMPITPGVILVETMAQVACFALYPWVNGGDPSMDRKKGFALRLAAVDAARFRRPVVPGDVMQITAEVKKFRSPVWGFHCKIEIDGELAAECEILASVTFGEKGELK